MKALKENAGSLLLCVFEAVVGILLLLDPIAFTTGIIVAFGVVLLLMGIGSAVGYFRMDALAGAASRSLLKGLILIAAGAFCVFRSYWFIISFPVLSVIYGVSILGAAAHQVGQILVAMGVMGSYFVAAYLPWLLLTSIATGLITGSLSAGVLQLLPREAKK